MKIHTKSPLLLYSYLATEMLGPFFASFLIMNCVFFLVKLIPFLNFVLELNIGIADFIRLFSYLFPNIFLYSIPMAAMMGVTIGFARLSSDSEILALKASGISMYQMLPPVSFMTWRPIPTKPPTYTGSILKKYKNSPPGPRMWGRIVAAPVWLPPEGATDRSLLARNPRGRGAERFQVNYHETGPSYASAYGLVAAYHQKFLETADGGIRLGGDEGIRTHGSVDYMSIMRRHSHGCHRLHNHIAVRLMSFVLAHRPHTREGQDLLYYRRILEHALRVREHMLATGQPRKLWVRTPLIPGVTATAENLRAIGRFIATELGDVVSRWELCAFNNLCADKYRRLGVYDVSLPLLQEALKLQRSALGSDAPESLAAASDLVHQYAREPRGHRGTRRRVVSGKRRRSKWRRSRRVVCHRVRTRAGVRRVSGKDRPQDPGDQTRAQGVADGRTLAVSAVTGPR